MLVAVNLLNFLHCGLKIELRLNWLAPEERTPKSATWFCFFDGHLTAGDRKSYSFDLLGNLRIRLGLNQRPSEIYRLYRCLVIARDKAGNRLAEKLLYLAQIEIDLLAPAINDDPNFLPRVAQPVKDF